MIGVLGANGFVGKNIVEYLRSKGYDVQEITKNNYEGLIGTKYDVFINANGNSKKYLAELNPALDFDLSVSSVYKTIFDFKFNKYIYISSIDSGKACWYGVNKHYAEEIIKDLYGYNGFKYSIIRCASIIGKGMSKGIIYDILNDIPLKVSKDSKIHITTIKMILNSIENSLKNQYYETNELYSKNSIRIDKIAKILNKKPQYGKNQQIYNSQVSDSVESAEYYLKESTLV